MGRFRSLSVLALGLLAGCASPPPFDARGVDASLTPETATSREAPVGTTIEWGGAIIGATNYPDRTQLEVLAYPLDRNRRPDIAGPPLGQFLISKPGYLEPLDYAEGRLVTVIGRLDGRSDGPAPSPVVSPRQLYLWPKTMPRSGAGLHIGIGIGYQN